MPSGQQWYMAIGGHQVGPIVEEEFIANIKSGSVDPGTLVFTGGMTAWTPLRDVAALTQYLPSAVSAARSASAPPPPPGRAAHDIDFRIEGVEMQFVEVELDPGESAVAEAGTFMYMTPGIEMETVFGDGSQQVQQGSGIMGALLGAGKRLLTGESLFMTVFSNKGDHQAAGGVCGAVCGQDPADGPEGARRRARVPEGLVPLCRAGRVDRDCVPEAARRGPVRRRRLHHAAPAGRRVCASCMRAGRSMRWS